METCIRSFFALGPLLLVVGLLRSTMPPHAIWFFTFVTKHILPLHTFCSDPELLCRRLVRLISDERNDHAVKVEEEHDEVETELAE